MKRQVWEDHLHSHIRVMDAYVDSLRASMMVYGSACTDEGKAGVLDDVCDTLKDIVRQCGFAEKACQELYKILDRDPDLR